MSIKFPVYQPSLRGNELNYVTECIESTWISSKGRFISDFEHQFAEYLNVGFATSVCNGTVALHLAMLALNINPGDEVIVPTFTYIASVNAIVYVGATPVFVDSTPETWQIDVADVQKKITGKTRAVLAPHIYGHPCDMDALVEMCKKHHLYLIEDCAEAIGSKYNNRHMGTYGDISAYSFFGNKTITTGEGGMVVSNSQELIEKARKIKNQGLAPIQYWHDAIGYNFRMTNICAAIGLAQLEKIETILDDKIRIANGYKMAFHNTVIEFHGQANNAFNSYWMCSILIPEAIQREELRDYLTVAGIETRPLFYPVHKMPMYVHLTNEVFLVADRISYRGLNLPSYPDLSDEDVKYIASKVIQFFQHQ